MGGDPAARDALGVPGQLSAPQGAREGRGDSPIPAETAPLLQSLLVFHPHVQPVPPHLCQTGALRTHLLALAAR